MSTTSKRAGTIVLAALMALGLSSCGKANTAHADCVNTVSLYLEAREAEGTPIYSDAIQTEISKMCDATDDNSDQAVTALG
jgi:hypothetical protein